MKIYSTRKSQLDLFFVWHGDLEGVSKIGHINWLPGKGFWWTHIWKNEFEIVFNDRRAS